MEKTTDRWWDKLGTPQYGGEMTIASRNIENFDPYFNEGLTTIQSAWMERLIADDWAVNPEEWNYRIHFRPDEYLKGHLAENWEFPDSNTLIVRLRQGIHWQDVPPVNEREFTADDVAYHYHRLFGLGSGFSQPAAAHANVVTAYRNLVSVSAEDKYTVIFKWTTIARESMKETLQAPTNAGCIEAREAVEKWGDVNDWRHAVGTGTDQDRCLGRRRRKTELQRDCRATGAGHGHARHLPKPRRSYAHARSGRHGRPHQCRRHRHAQ